MAGNQMKRSKPMTMLEFLECFPTDEACAEFLFKCRWPNGWQCPKCGRTKAYYIEKRALWECAACHRQTSVTARTVLHGTRTHLRLWFLAMFLMVSDKRGISSVGLGQRIGVRQATAWCDLQKLRRAMQEREERYRLNGTVMLSKRAFGDPKEGGRRSPDNSKTPVLVALSQTGNGGPRYLRATALSRLDCDSIKKAVESTIHKGATVQTDCLRDYLRLTSWGYSHDPIPAEDLDALRIRKWSKTIISNARAFVAGTYHGVSHKHLPSYLSEFEYRFNRRFRLDRMFTSIVTAAAECKAWTYADIVRKPRRTAAAL